MKQRVFDVAEMYRFGLNKGEIMDIIGSAYEAEVADALAKKAKMQAIADAKKRVANDTYTLEDLELLKEGIKFRVVPPKKVVAKIDRKSVAEFEEMIKRLNPLP